MILEFFQIFNNETAKKCNADLKKSSKKWDGGYVIGGMIGHGDSFVMRDPHGIRPAYYFEDEEVVVVASERPAIFFSIA